MKLKEWSTLGTITLAILSCTHKVQIEPSDKPFLVNMNLKIDHEIKMKIEQENQDLLNLEKNVRNKKGG